MLNNESAYAIIKSRHMQGVRGRERERESDTILRGKTSSIHSYPMGGVIYVHYMRVLNQEDTIGFVG